MSARVAAVLQKIGCDEHELVLEDLGREMLISTNLEPGKLARRDAARKHRVPQLFVLKKLTVNEGVQIGPELVESRVCIHFVL